MGARLVSIEQQVPWLRSIGSACWVSDPDRTICHVNSRGAELLGLHSEDVLGRSCHEVIAGTDSFERPFCSPRCPVRDRCLHGKALEPVTFQAGPAGARTWITVQCISVTCGGWAEPLLVHCAQDARRDMRFRRYLESVASRSEAFHGDRLGTLTPRESEVLGLLAEDLALCAIARRLHISRVTVRNHVHHILEKLGTHSIQESVARFLIES